MPSSHHHLLTVATRAALAAARRGGALAVVVLARGAPAAAAWLAAVALKTYKLLLTASAWAAASLPRGHGASALFARSAMAVAARAGALVPRLSVDGARGTTRRSLVVDVAGGWMR